MPLALLTLLAKGSASAGSGVAGASGVNTAAQSALGGIKNVSQMGTTFSPVQENLGRALDHESQTHTSVSNPSEGTSTKPHYYEAPNDWGNQSFNWDLNPDFLNIDGQTGVGSDRVNGTTPEELSENTKPGAQTPSSRAGQSKDQSSKSGHSPSQQTPRDRSMTDQPQREPEPTTKPGKTSMRQHPQDGSFPDSRASQPKPSTPKDDQNNSDFWKGFASEVFSTPDPMRTTLQFALPGGAGGNVYDGIAGSWNLWSNIARYATSEDDSGEEAEAAMNLLRLIPMVQVHEGTERLARLAYSDKKLKSAEDGKELAAAIKETGAGIEGTASVFIGTLGFVKKPPSFKSWAIKRENDVIDIRDSGGHGPRAKRNPETEMKVEGVSPIPVSELPYQVRDPLKKGLPVKGYHGDRNMGAGRVVLKDGTVPFDKVYRTPKKRKSQKGKSEKERSKTHNEQQVIQELENLIENGLPVKKLKEVGIYTERSPCVYCAKRILDFENKLGRPGLVKVSDSYGSQKRPKAGGKKSGEQ